MFTAFGRERALLHLFVACIERGNDRYTLYLITLKFYILYKTNNYAFITLGSKQEGSVHTLMLADPMFRYLAATTQGCGRDEAHVLPRGGSDCVGAALGIDNLSFTACQRLIPRVRRLSHTCYAAFRCTCLNEQHHSVYEQFALRSSTVSCNVRWLFPGCEQTVKEAESQQAAVLVRCTRVFGREVPITWCYKKWFVGRKDI